jgi:hypothetical protein
MPLRSFKFKLRPEQLAEATAEFYHFYGHALARWSQLETAFYYWFERTTGMQDAMARAIFYGGRGFFARAEMLEAAIEHATTLDPTQSAFLKEALKRAKGYSSFRNKIAHGEPRLNVVEATSETKLHYTITQGRNTPATGEESISVTELATAADNFHTLAQCIRDVLPFPVRNPKAKSPEECLALVRSLPIEPNVQNSPTAAAPASQSQEPQHRNKKEHRAAQKARKEGPPSESQ